MKKLKRPSVGNVERENERDQTYEAKNPKIDLSRTHDNYHIIAPPQSYMDFINERIASLNLKRKVRSDAIYMNTFVLSSGHEFFENMPLDRQYQFFKQVFADNGFCAAVCFGFSAAAFVVKFSFAFVSDAAFGADGFAAIAANEFSAQKIDVIDASFSVFVLCDDSANFFKQRRRDDLRVHISEQIFAVTVDACVFFIAEYIIDGVFAERFIMVSDPFRIEIGDNVSDNDAFGVFVVNEADDFCLIFVNDDFSAVQFITVGQTAALKISFQSCFPHSALYLLGKLCGVVFGQPDVHIFEENAVEIFCPVNVFRSSLGRRDACFGLCAVCGYWKRESKGILPP